MFDKTSTDVSSADDERPTVRTIHHALCIYHNFNNSSTGKIYGTLVAVSGHHHYLSRILDLKKIGES